MSSIGIGEANSGAQGFIGFNAEALEDYVKNICAKSIKDASEALKDTKKLYQTFETGWSGKAVQNFELQVDVAVTKVIISMAQALDSLQSELAKVANAMIAQDESMIDNMGLIGDMMSTLFKG